MGIDPGHNGDNWEHTSYINQSVWNGREEETCDTTGTQEANGYTEAQFAFNVAQYLAATLQAQGATVVLTRTTNSGYGPCITERAGIVNNAGAQWPCPSTPTEDRSTVEASLSSNRWPAA